MAHTPSNPTAYFVFLKRHEFNPARVNILVREVRNKRIPAQLDFAFPSWAIGNRQFKADSFEWMSAGNERIALRVCAFGDQLQAFLPADHPFVWKPLVEFVMKMGASDTEASVAHTRDLADRYVFPYLNKHHPMISYGIRFSLHDRVTYFACIRGYANDQGQPSLCILVESIRSRCQLPSARVPNVPTYPFECFPTLNVNSVYSWNALRIYKHNEHKTALSGDLGDVFQGRSLQWIDLYTLIEESSKAASEHFTPVSCAYVRETLLPYLKAHHRQILDHADVESYVWRDALYPEIWSISRNAKLRGARLM
jgi:hypothetical protein